MRIDSTKPEAGHHLPVVTGKVELRPVPGRKRPHEDVEVVEVWLLFFKGAGILTSNWKLTMAGNYQRRPFLLE